MIKDVEQAHAALADALWWLRGFASAAPDNPETRDMAEGLRQVREYLDRIKGGWVRRIGDEQAVVITYAEFERLYDALAHPAASEADKPAAVEALKAIMHAYQAESAAARKRSDEIPF